LISVCCSIILGAGSQESKPEINRLVPQAGDVDGWLPEGEAQFEIGQDLYLLINGGADIYHEYGFRAVVFQSYRTEDGKSINLEIYEMDSQEAAYGIYTFKTGSEGNPIELGYEGWLNSYYVNFWEGNFLITVIGLDSDSDILDGIKKIAKAVDLKLNVKSERPNITSYLPQENLQINGITYLKGNLALFNQYLFYTEDIFGLKEGVIGKYDDYSIFLFQYGNQEESKKWYEVAKNHLKHSNHYNDFVDRASLFEICNHQNNRLSIKQFQNWILIISGKIKTNANQILNSLEARLAQ
jgi:hypothetical protein